MDLEQLKQIREKYSNVVIENPVLRKEIDETLEYLNEVIKDLEGEK